MATKHEIRFFEAMLDFLKADSEALARASEGDRIPDDVAAMLSDMAKAEAHVMKRIAGLLEKTVGSS